MSVILSSNPVSFLSYSMLYNKINPISYVKIDSSEDLHSLELTLSWKNDLIKPNVYKIDKIESNKTFKLENIIFKPDLKKFASLKESITDTLVFTLKDCFNNVLANEQVDIRIVKFDTACGLIENLQLVASFINPHEPKLNDLLINIYHYHKSIHPSLTQIVNNEILPIIFKEEPKPITKSSTDESNDKKEEPKKLSKAAQLLRDNANSRIVPREKPSDKKEEKELFSGFLGYLSSNTHYSVLEIESIIEYLNNEGFTLNKVDRCLDGDCTIRSVSQIFKSKNGNVLELAILLSSILERISYNCGLVFTSLRVYVVVFLENLSFNKVLIDDLNLIKNLIAERKVLLVDPLVFVNPKDSINDLYIKCNESNLKELQIPSLKDIKPENNETIKEQSLKALEVLSSAQLTYKDTNIDILKSIEQDFICYLDLRASRASIKSLPIVTFDEKGDVLDTIEKEVSNKQSVNLVEERISARRQHNIEKAMPLMSSSNNNHDLGGGDESQSKNQEETKISRNDFSGKRESKSENWLSSLIDISLNNRFLNICDEFINFKVSAPLNLKDSLSLLANKPLVLKKDSLKTNFKHDKPLDLLLIEGAQEEQETVSKVLHLTLGQVTWRESNISLDTYIAPLVLINVKLEKDGENLVLSAFDNNFIINLSLLEMLSSAFCCEISLDKLLKDIHALQDKGDFEGAYNNLLDKLKEHFEKLGFTYEFNIRLANFEVCDLLLWQDIKFNHSLFRESKIYRAFDDNKNFSGGIGSSIELKLMRFKNLKDFMNDEQKGELSPKNLRLSKYVDRVYEQHAAMNHQVDNKEDLLNEVDNFESVIHKPEGYHSISPEFLVDASVLIESADAGQLKAISETLTKDSYILQTAPGTGKIQALVNVIVNTINQKKTVLYVSDKKAQLQKMYNSLKKHKLSEYVLKLFDIYDNFEIVKELKKGLTKTAFKSSFSQEELDTKTLLDDLNAKAKLLDNYAMLMSSNRDIGLSLSEAIDLTIFYKDKNLEFKDEELSKFTVSDDALVELDKRTINKAHKTIDEIFKTLEKTQTSIVNHPLAQIRATFLPDECLSDGYKVLSDKFKTHIDKMLEVQNHFAKLFNIDHLISNLTFFKKFDKFIDDIHYLRLLDPGLLKLLVSGYDKKNIDKLLSESESLLIIKDKLGNNADNLAQLDVESLKQKWERNEQSFVLIRMFKYKKYLRLLRRVSGGELDVKIDNFMYYLRIITSYKNDYAKLLDDGKDIKDASEQFFNYILNKLPKARDVLVENLRFLDVLKNLEFNEKTPVFVNVFAKHLEEKGATFVDELIEYRHQYQSSYKDFVDEFNKIIARYDVVDGTVPVTVLEIEKMLKHWDDNSHLLRDWIGLNKYLTVFRSIRIPEFKDVLVDGIVNKDNAKDYLLKVVCKSALDYYFRNYELLKEFNKEVLTNKVSELRTLYQKLIDISKDKVLSTIYNTYSKHVSEKDADKFLNEANKVLNKDSSDNSLTISAQILKLFKDFSRLLKTLYPIMLVSKEQAVKYLSAKDYNFDMVIFEESGQTADFNTVSILARGKKAVINGDGRGLTPINRLKIFDNQLYSSKPLVSILDIAKKLSVPKISLNNHYRCRSDSLIAFSNKYLYNSNLVSYASPITDSKVQLIEVKEEVNSQICINHNEVNAILNFMSDFIKKEDNRSIGIVAFSKKQRDLIIDKLTQYSKEHPEFEKFISSLKEPFFVKSIEDVGGDIRDVIIISIGISKLNDDSYSLDYGVMSKINGMNYLNTVITRAREELLVFSALTAQGMRVYNDKNESVMTLLNFLNFAKYGISALGINENCIDCRSHIMESLANKLSSLGYSYTLNFGLSKFKIPVAIKNLDNLNCYTTAILIEDMYRASAAHNAYDLFVAQENMLKLRGWQVIKIWSLDYLKDPQKAINEVIQQL
jgi:hypothetical protein